MVLQRVARSDGGCSCLTLSTVSRRWISHSARCPTPDIHVHVPLHAHVLIVHYFSGMLPRLRNASCGKAVFEGMGEHQSLEG